jgi:hypothetical protein
MEDCYYKKDSEYFINKLKNDEYFSIARYNDGEWHCMRNREDRPRNSIANCDKHRYFPELKQELLTAVTSEDNAKHSEDEKYFFQASLFYWKPSWYDDYINWGMKVKFLQNDYIREIMYDPDKWIPMINILNTKNVIMIAPKHIKLYKKKLDYKEFIEIPYRQCYLEKDRVIKEMREYMNKYDHIVFIFCASMMTNAIIDNLFLETKDKHFMLDFGSAIDTFIDHRRVGRRIPRRIIGNGLRELRKKYPKGWIIRG